VTAYALLDINNMFVSCERAFDPMLERVPVLVLSSNDGCAIARSQEVKDLGVKMGDPYFKVARLCEDNGVVCMSSNFSLYCSMSMRLVAELRDLCPAVEQYSIDEVYIDLTGMPGGLDEYCRGVRKAIRRRLGLPNCVGTGATKTLAKLANRLAKKSKTADGVVDLAGHPAWTQQALERTQAADVWGIGPASAAKLLAIGVRSAKDFAGLPDSEIRRLMGVPGLRVAGELRGQVCHTLETIPEPRQSLMVSRSFGEPTGSRDAIKQAIVGYVASAGEKLRREAMVAGAVTVFWETPRFRKDLPQRNASSTARLHPASSDSLRLLQAALKAFDGGWVDGPWTYAKAGVMLTDLCMASAVSGDLFSVPEPPSALMGAIDRINARWGRGSLTLGHRGGPGSPCKPRAERLSPDWLGSWDQIPVAKAKPPKSAHG